MNREKAQLFKFFKGSLKTLPPSYIDAFICMTLKITQTELDKQPADWVENIMALHEAKAQVQEYENKKQEARTRKRGR